MIPTFMRLRIAEKGKKSVRLFIPLLLVWIFLLPFLILLLPFLLIAAIITIPWGIGLRVLLFYPLFFSLLNSLSGLAIHVENPDKQLLLVFK